MGLKYDISDIKKLREQTKLSVLSCKKALVASGNDLNKALSFLKKNTSSLGSQPGNYGEGTIGVYMHYNNRLGVLLQLNCKTDFITKNETFKSLVKKLCIHIASLNPLYKSINSIGLKFLFNLKVSIAKGFIKLKGCNGNGGFIGINKSCRFKLKDWFNKNCLLEQDFVMDGKTKVNSLLSNYSSLLGESINVSRYTVYTVK
jgi:elongation factor Ts